MPDPAPLDFAIDLQSVQDRLMALDYFLSAQDVQSATEAMALEAARPPCAFVSIAAETAAPNRLVRPGGHAQQVTVSLSILFAEMTARAAGDTRDRVELTRKAIIRQLIAWTPVGAEQPLDYDRYILRATSDYAIWGEVLFRTTYRLQV